MIWSAEIDHRSSGVGGRQQRQLGRTGRDPPNDRAAIASNDGFRAHARGSRGGDRDEESSDTLQCHSRTNPAVGAVTRLLQPATVSRRRGPGMLLNLTQLVVLRDLHIQLRGAGIPGVVPY